jgi:hypothetical protein
VDAVPRGSIAGVQAAGLCRRCPGARDSVAVAGHEYSNISVANEVAGSLTGSQRPQMRGYAMPHAAAAGVAKRHVRPHMAPPGDTSKVPSKQ